jgi:hypothetical protein
MMDRINKGRRIGLGIGKEKEMSGEGMRQSRQKKERTGVTVKGKNIICREE